MLTLMGFLLHFLGFNTKAMLGAWGMLHLLLPHPMLPFSLGCQEKLP